MGLRRPVEERPLRAAGCPAGGSRGCRGVLGPGMGRDGPPRSPPAVSGMLGWGKFPQYWDKGEGRDAPGAAAIAAPCLGCGLFHVKLISERNLAWTRSLAHQGGWVVPQPSPQCWSLPSPQPPATIPLPRSAEGHPQRCVRAALEHARHEAIARPVRCFAPAMALLILASQLALPQGLNLPEFSYQVSWSRGRVVAAPQPPSFVMRRG